MEKKNQKQERVNVYQMVTDRVIEQMQKGIIPWHRPWTGASDGAINYVSRKPYSLLNQMLLGRDGEWLTWKQLKERGGSINKGAKAGMVVFFKKFSFIKEEPKVDGTTSREECTVPVLKYYNVFHIDDCTGIESKLTDGQPASDIEPVEQAEAIIAGYVGREKTLKFQNDQPSNRAFYRPSDDLVVVPMLTQYAEVEEYYSTTFHELTHSTMTEYRCNPIHARNWLPRWVLRCSARWRT